jgi:hypothetical protein
VDRIIMELVERMDMSDDGRHSDIGGSSSIQ